jgi:hypothetical protein
MGKARTAHIAAKTFCTSGNIQLRWFAAADELSLRADEPLPIQFLIYDLVNCRDLSDSQSRNLSGLRLF